MTFDFWNDGTNVLICDMRNYLGSEISRSQMCYLWSEISDRQDYLGYDISSTSFSKPFSSYQVFFQSWTAEFLESLKKLFVGLTKLLDINNPVPKLKKPPPPWGSTVRFFQKKKHKDDVWERGSFDPD